nr:alpha-2-macroglobulin [Saprospiraceae bacterium]
HQNDAEPDALIQIDLERLEFVRAHLRSDRVEELYESALSDLLKKYASYDAAADVGYQLASLYYAKGENYRAGQNPDLQWKKKEALALCEQMIEKYPNSRGANNCKILQHNILLPALNITTEQHVVANQKALMLVNYKNVEDIYFKIKAVDPAEARRIRDLYGENLKQYLSAVDGQQTWSTKAPNEGDFQAHGFETELPSQGPGMYIVVASTRPDFESYEATLGYSIVQFTNLAYTSRRNQGYMDFYALDRNSGQPLKNAEVTIYSRNNRNSEYNVARSFTTDENGYGKVNLGRRMYNLGVEINHKGETAVFDNFYYQEAYKDQTRTYEQAFVFTDRSIYRPGQTVHFKAVVIKTDTKDSELITGKSTKVIFRDANYEEITSETFTTNEYGSIHGSFTIPQGRLTGMYRIETPFGSQAFSVEEYKRPKFEVEFQPIEGNFKLNQTITAKGSATAYAGSSITNAKVQYRVTRVARFPYWYYSWYRPAPSSPSREIAFGITTTDDAGNFEIPFEALPDQNLNPDDLPVFDYQITADVTDINGETRSSTTMIVVGYTAMNASLSVTNPLQRSAEGSVEVSTQNLNGQPVAASGQVTVFKLKGPEQAERTRPWTQPDQATIEAAAFRKSFPYFPTKHPNYASWEKGEQVWKASFKTDDTSGTEALEFGSIKKWNIGWYVAELTTKDAFGKEITAKNYFFISDFDSKTVADHQLLELQLDKTSYSPGEMGYVKVGSGAEDAYVILEFEHEGKIVHKEHVQLNNSTEKVCFNIEEKHLGGVVVHATIIKYNSQVTTSSMINVPYPETDLQIEVGTFRDKLEPGQEETWTFKIKGPEGEKVATELLASMYDASLDQFRGHGWNMGLYQRAYYSRLGGYQSNSFGQGNFQMMSHYPYDYSYSYQAFDQLNPFGLYFGYNHFSRRLEGRVRGVSISDTSVDEVMVMGSAKQKKASAAAPPPPMAEAEMVADSAGFLNEDKEEDQNSSNASGENGSSLSGVVARKNLQETAFFYPDLMTDADGNVTFSFTIPEALTQWKLMLLGHSKALNIGRLTKTVVTQKELMVLPNAPRFFREKDVIRFTSKVANVSEKALAGQAELQLFDALTMERIDERLGNQEITKDFSIAAGGNTNLTWQLTIPDDVDAVTYRVVAKAGDFSDGEENVLPVLSNRMLVTETLPMPIRSNQSRTFVLDKLRNNNSNTLKHHKLTIEMTSNPAWYAVQSLPYLMEFPYECAEQTFSRYYANTLATHIANSDPKIKQVFNTWRNYQPDALMSNLEKNQELKSLLLRETPWVRDAKNEAEQKRRIALLFDINKMRREQSKALNQLNQMQLSSGGWPWFAGGPDNRYITQHIVAGLGHLDHLDVEEVRKNKSTWSMTAKAVKYLDEELLADFNRLKRYDKNWNNGQKKFSYIQLHYFYTRSFFQDIPVQASSREAFEFYKKQIEQYWLSNSLYSDGLAALALHRYGNTELPAKLVKSLDERSITNDELGMYWKENTGSWWWYQAPIETQALMIEVFDEVADDQAKVDELKVWLLKNKQTNSWKTTKATSEAIYALLLRGGEWLAVDELVDITIAGQRLKPQELDGVDIEAGTGYFKTAWNTTEVQPEMAEVTLAKKGEGIAWGALYWQYFEDLDKITPAETPLKLNKKVFKQTNTKSGPEIRPVSSETKLEVGDLLKVRIELRVDRAMEFVHMKDMRAAGFEPVNVLSQYKWQDGLGYYESTKDASTDFFFDYLPKGVYVFEYPLRINHAGDFSNGITTIQCMYAPEFTSHSEGIRLTVE